MTTLTASEIEALNQTVNQVGVVAAAIALRMYSKTLARALAGQNIAPKTAAYLRSVIAGIR